MGRGRAAGGAKQRQGAGARVFRPERDLRLRRDRAEKRRAGGDGFLYKDLAAGADLGYHFERASVGFGLASANGSYHFGGRKRGRALVPFVTAGYAVAFREGSLQLWNFGGGVTYWFRDRLGARFEVREYRDQQYHFLTAFRFGLTFR